MSVSRIDNPSAHPLRARRSERLRREIALLEHMDSRLWRKALLCAVIGVATTVALLLAVAVKLHYFAFHPLAVTIVSVALAVLVWWIGRYTLTVPLILIVLLLGILFEGGIELPNFGDGKSKANRRRKLDAALARRRKALAKLEARA